MVTGWPTAASTRAPPFTVNVDSGQAAEVTAIAASFDTTALPSENR